MNKRLTLKQKKKVTRDCWNLDYAFLQWLQPRLKTYLKDADKIVDLDYVTITIDGKEMTQKEIINRMIYLCDRVVDEDFDNSLYWNDEAEWRKEQKELCLLWAEILPAMW